MVSGLQTGAQGINTQIGQAQNEAQTASKAASDAIANQTGALNTAVQGQLTNAQDQNQSFAKQYQAIQEGLGYGTGLSTSQYGELGMSPDQYKALQDATARAGTSEYMTAPNFGNSSATSQINNAQFLSPFTPSDVNANQVATPQQFQQLQALLQLNNNQLPTGAAINPDYASEAGTYQAPTFNGMFNYNNALQNAQSVGDQERADALAKSQSTSAQAQAAHDAGKKGLGGFASSPFGTLAKYMANPVLAVPKEVQYTQKLAGKI